MAVAAVVLAAGASTRLGLPKQLSIVGSETLLERAIRVARGAGCSPVVVLGCSADAILAACDLQGAEVVINEGWVEGMGSSIRAGVGALRGVDGCVLTTCDMPAVTAAHLQALMETGESAASLYGGRTGVPAYFPASAFPELMELRGDLGAREMLRSARGISLPGGKFDVDTMDDLKRVRELFG